MQAGVGDGEDDEVVVETGHIFNTSQLFASREEAIAHALRVGRNNNIFLIRQTLRDEEQVLTCERYGKSRSSTPSGSRSSQDDTATSNRHTSKKCGCPFRLSIRGGGASGWSIVVMQSMHNHQLARNPQGHFTGLSFSVDERTSLRNLHKSGVPPRQLFAHLHDQNRHSTADRTSIYNLVSKFKREDRAGGGDVSSLVHSLKEKYYSYWTEKDSSKFVAFLT